MNTVQLRSADCVINEPQNKVRVGGGGGGDSRTPMWRGGGGPITWTFKVIYHCITISLRMKGWTFIIDILPPPNSVTEYFLNQASCTHSDNTYIHIIPGISPSIMFLQQLFISASICFTFNERYI